MKNFDFGGIVDNNPREKTADDREDSYRELVKDDDEEVLADPLEAGHLAADEIMAERSIDKMEAVERVKE